MARPQRNEVDYFPFYCKEGRVMFIIEQKYGNDGYATWVKLLRALATTNFHYLDLSKDFDVEYLSTKCRISSEMLIEIIELLVMSGEFDKELWEEKRVVWSDKFIDSIQDAYSRRNNNLMNRDALIHKLGGLCSTITPKKGTITPQTSKKDDNNPQSKVKYSKEKKNKESEIDFSPFGSSFEIHWQTWIGYKLSQFKFKYRELSSEQMAFNDLVKKSNGEPLQAIAMINNSIVNGWKGLIAIKDHYPQFDPLDKQTIYRPIGTTKSMFE